MLKSRQQQTVLHGDELIIGRMECHLDFIGLIPTAINKSRVIPEDRTFSGCESLFLQGYTSVVKALSDFMPSLFKFFI